MPFKPLPVGILGDMSRGALSGRDFLVYCWLLANSHWRGHTLSTSAGRLGEALSLSADAVLRALHRLEAVGWIRRDWKRGQRGDYIVRVLVQPSLTVEPCTSGAQRGANGGADGDADDSPHHVTGLFSDEEPRAGADDVSTRGADDGADGGAGPSSIEIEKEKGGGGGECPSSFSLQRRTDLFSPPRQHRAPHLSATARKADLSGKEGEGAPASLKGTPPPDDDTDSGNNTLRGVLRHWRKVFPLAGNISDEMAQKVFEEAHTVGMGWGRMRALMEQHLRLTGDRGAAPWRILREEMGRARRGHGRSQECRECREGIIEALVTDADGELDMMRLRCSCRVAEIRSTQGARPLASLPRLDNLIPPQRRKQLGIFAHGGRLKRLTTPPGTGEAGQGDTTPTIMLGTSRLTCWDGGG